MRGEAKPPRRFLVNLPMSPSAGSLPGAAKTRKEEPCRSTQTTRPEAIGHGNHHVRRDCRPCPAGSSRFPLVDRTEPNLLEETFDYGLPPLIRFDGPVVEYIDGKPVEFDPQALKTREIW